MMLSATRATPKSTRSIHPTSSDGSNNTFPQTISVSCILCNLLGTGFVLLLVGVSGGILQYAA